MEIQIIKLIIYKYKLYIIDNDVEMKDIEGEYNISTCM